MVRSDAKHRVSHHEGKKLPDRLNSLQACTNTAAAVRVAPLEIGLNRSTFCLSDRCRSERTRDSVTLSKIDMQKSI